MQNCESVNNLLNDFLDGVLSAALATEINEHLEECARCHKEYQALEATRRLLQSLAVPSGEASRERVMARFRHEVQETRPQQSKPSFRNWTPAIGLTLATALTMTLFFTRPPRAPQPVSIIASAAPDTLPTLADLTLMDDLHSARSLEALNYSDALPEELSAETALNANEKAGTHP